MDSILIVDDEVSITSALSYFLESEGFETAVAHTGRDALSQLSTDPDLVVLDIMLPDMDGYQICQHIRRGEMYIPVLMLTAKDTTSDRIMGLDTGADAYITKPYHLREVLAQIRALLRITAGQNDDTIQCGNVILSPNKRTVIQDGVLVNLTAIEFQILELFMKSPGRVFGRETLLRSVWGYDQPAVTSRTIDTHIQRLRRKIEHEPKEPQLIQTVRGFGYRLVCPDKDGT